MTGLWAALTGWFAAVGVGVMLDGDAKTAYGMFGGALLAAAYSYFDNRHARRAGRGE